MKHPDDLLQRMLRAAKQPCPPSQNETAPFGFSSRVAALWAQPRNETPSVALWERWCARSAMVVAMAALVVSLTVWRTWVPIESDEETTLVRHITEIALQP